MPLLVSPFLMDRAIIQRAERISVILMTLSSSINTYIINIAIRKNNVKNL
jgi:hypothetical protein